MLLKMLVAGSWKLYFVGYKGVIQGIYDNLPEALSSGRHPTPLLEVDALSVVESESEFRIKTDDCDSNMQRDIGICVAEWYLKKAVFGPYGDIIQLNYRTVACKPIEESFLVCTIDFIGRRAFHKPGLAADIVPFVRDIDGNLFFVGILRGKDPGKGKVAFAGGFVDIKGFKMETGAVCGCREGGEEINMEVIPAEEEPYATKFRMKPNADFLPVRVCIGDVRVKTTLRLVGTFFTSDEEKLPAFGVKRIYQTTAYTVVIPVSRKLTADDVVKFFKAGDDAAEVVAIPFNQLYKTEFAFGHHAEIFLDAVRIVEAECKTM